MNKLDKNYNFKTCKNLQNIFILKKIKPILKHKFIIHKRELTSATVEEQGLIFYEEGEPGRPRWQITHSDSRGSLMILDCEKNIVV